MLHTAILVLLLVLFLRIITLRLPLRWKIPLNAACALGSLIVLNLLQPVTGMFFELNVLTAGTVAVLGLPGVCLLWLAHAVLGL